MTNKLGQQKISKAFYENPTRKFQIREIARQLKTPKTTVSYHIGNLLKEGQIIKDKGGIFPSFKANEDSERYKFSKREYFLNKLINTGLLDYLEERATPRCIILFGSFAKAEYDSKSDIDIFVQSNKTELNLQQFEKKLGHPINILFEPDIHRLSPGLLNNIANGIKLRGYLKIK